MRGLALMIPEELLFMLLVAGGMAMIVGAKKAGSTLIATGLALAILPALLLPLFESLPGGLLSVLLGFFALAIIFSCLRWISTAMIGERATDGMVGHLAADAVKATFRGVFGLVVWFFRGLGRALFSIFRA